MTKYVDGQVMELEPNEGYWQGKPKLVSSCFSQCPSLPPGSRDCKQGTSIGRSATLYAVAQSKDEGFHFITGPYPTTSRSSAWTVRRQRSARASGVELRGGSLCAGRVVDGFGIREAQYIHKGHLLRRFVGGLHIRPGDSEAAPV